MNLHQFEYLIALDRYRNFSTAAKSCYVTQPALTVQIKNLEDELKAVLFDRSKKPLMPTEAGKAIIEQARIIMRQTGKLKDIVTLFSSEIAGELRLGIIPTVSPYLIPLFINEFNEKYSKVKLYIEEEITENILSFLKDGIFDAGIIVTPFKMKGMITRPLYYEKFYAYVSNEHELAKKRKLKTTDLSINNLWLLKEGNCFRNQVINICAKTSDNNSQAGFHYESYSLDSLKRIVEKKKGVTVIPELAADDIPEENRNMLKHFSDFTPIREVSLVINRIFLKKRMIDGLADTIIENIPKRMRKADTSALIDTSI